MCRRHGGAAPQVRRRAAERVAAQTALQWARDELAERGTPDLDPLEHLERALEEAARLYWLADLACVWEVEQGGSLMSRGHDGLEVESPRSIDRARALQQWARTSKMALDAGVAERKVRIRLEQGQMMLGVAEGLFRLLQAEGVTGAVLQRAQRFYGEEVRKLGDIQGQARLEA